MPVLYWVALITLGIDIFLLAYLPAKKAEAFIFYWRQKICKPKHGIIREHKTVKNYSHKVCLLDIGLLLQ